MRLVPDRRHLDGEMGVVGEQRTASRASRRADDPAVAAAGAGPDGQPSQPRRQRRFVERARGKRPISPRVGDLSTATVVVGRGCRRNRRGRLDNRRSARGPYAHQTIRFGGADGACQPSAHELAPAVLRQPPGEQPRNRQGVDWRPRLRLDTQRQEFRRTPPASHLGHRRVHAPAVLFECGADQGRRRLPFFVGRTAQP